MSHRKDGLTQQSIPTLLGLAISTLIAVGPLAATSAMAAEQYYSISIEATPLGEALLTIARQSGERISFDPALVPTLTAQPLRGQLTVEQALNLVLLNSGLKFFRTPNGSYSIAAEPTEQTGGTSTSTSLELSPMTVWAKREALGYAADSATAATRTDTSLLELPRSVSVVSKELMRDKQTTSVVDALSNVSGVSASSGGGINPASISIRGFRVDNAMTDGMMSNGRYGFSTPTIALDKIEVVKGPEGITGGRAARFGGVVNMVGKRPQAYTERELQIVADDQGRKQLGLDLTGPLTDDKRLRGRFIAMGEDGADTDLGWDGGDTQYLAPQLAWVDDDNKFLIGAEFKNEKRPAGNDVFTLSDRLSDHAAVTPHAKDDRAEYKTRRYYMDLQRYLGDDWTVNLKGQYAQQDGSIRNWTSTILADFPGLPPGIPGFPPGGIPAGDLLVASGMKQDLDYRSTTLQATISKPFSLGPTDHDVMVGYDSFDGKYTHNISTLSDPNDPLVVISEGESRVLPSVSSLASEVQAMDGFFFRSKETGYFIQDQASWGNWNVLASARRVSYRSKSESNAEPLDKWLYGLGITYTFTPGVSAYASYSQGVTNSFAYLTRDGSSLPPTEAEQYEVGAKFGLLDERLVLTTAVFRIQEKNTPAVDPTNPLYYRTQEGIESKGVEVELRGRVTNKLNISLAYTNMTSEQMEDSSIKTGIPRQRLNLWATYQVAPGWSIGTGIDARSVIKAEGITEDRTLTAPGQARLDAMVRYDAKTWSAMLGVRNIADRRLYDDGISPASTYVEPERTFTLSSSIKF